MKIELNDKHKLFERLINNPPEWWEVLSSDKDIYIDIRKDNYIDVYFNGGCIIKELKHNGKSYSGKIHYKYLLPEKQEYIKYSLDDSSISPSKKEIELFNFKKFESAIIKRLKANVAQYFPVESEKGIQAKFIKKAGQFIDSEFAYKYDGNKLRIDLVWIDIRNKKILLVELKTMGDSRLYTSEIYKQLKKYHDFAKKYEKEIANYYERIFSLKKRLDILPSGLRKLEAIDGFSVEKKPLLLFGDCQQEWIKNNSQELDDKIKKVAIGAYYFGKPEYNCDLILKSQKNRHIFLS